MMDIGKTVRKAFSRAPRSAPVAKLPGPAEGGGLTEPEMTHLGLALDSWSAGSPEKKHIAGQLLEQAKTGEMKATIVWAHDLPDMTGSRFVVARAGAALKSDPLSEVERLQAECAQRKGKLPPSEELSLINRCMDLYEATDDARSPLVMKRMVELGARACQLLIQKYKMDEYRSHQRLDVKILGDICWLKTKSDIYRAGDVYRDRVYLPESGYIQFQLALERLLRVTEGAGMRLGISCEIHIGTGPSDLEDYEELTDSDVREFFKTDEFFSIAGDGWYRLGVNRKNLEPRWKELRQKDADRWKQAVQAEFPAPSAVLDLAAGWVSGPQGGPSKTELQTYALKMAELLEPKNTNGQPTHIVVQRALTAIKAYNDYFAASSSDPTLELDWTKLKACVETVGAWRAQLGGGAFPDADAEQAYQRLLKAEPPVEPIPRSG